MFPSPKNVLSTKKTYQNILENIEAKLLTLEKPKGITQLDLEEMNSQQVLETLQEMNKIKEKIKIYEELFPTYTAMKTGNSNLLINYLFPKSTTHKRFFLIIGDTIFYYADSKFSHQKGSIVIDLNTGISLYTHEVSITQKDRIWKMSFDSNNKAQEFNTAIQNIITTKKTQSRKTAFNKVLSSAKITN